ncbi:MAG: Maf family nucleotide pyrophosphatase [Pseudomonadota bacterium]
MPTANGSDHAPDLVLASGSAARYAMLKNAGLSFTIVPADIDEEAVKQSFGGDQVADPADLAEVLARAKAMHVAEQRPGSLIIAADQILMCEQRLFSKPKGLDGARETLQALRGRKHQLFSAVAIAQGSEVPWTHVEQADLTMRSFSSDFLASYILHSGDELCESVGAYKLEGLGIQLFDRIDGDFFTILGLPLLPLLSQLRAMGLADQ